MTMCLSIFVLFYVIIKIANASPVEFETTTPSSLSTAQTSINEALPSNNTINTNILLQHLTANSLDFFEQLFNESLGANSNRTVRSFQLIQSSLEALKDVVSAGLDAMATGVRTVSEVSEAAVNTTKAGMESAKLLTSFITEAVAAGVEEKSDDVADMVSSLGEKGSRVITMVADGANVVANAIMKAIEAARATGTTEMIKGFFSMMLNSKSIKSEE